MIDGDPWSQRSCSCGPANSGRNSSLCMNRNKSARGLLPTWELGSAADPFLFYFALKSVKEVCHHKDGAPKTKSVKDKMDLQPPKAKGGQSPLILNNIHLGNKQQALADRGGFLLCQVFWGFIRFCRFLSNDQPIRAFLFGLDRGISILILSMIFSYLLSMISF